MQNITLIYFEKTSFFFLLFLLHFPNSWWNIIYEFLFCLNMFILIFQLWFKKRKRKILCFRLIFFNVWLKGILYDKFLHDSRWILNFYMSINLKDPDICKINKKRRKIIYLLVLLSCLDSRASYVQLDEIRSLDAAYMN